MLLATFEASHSCSLSLTHSLTNKIKEVKLTMATQQAKADGAAATKSFVPLGEKEEGRLGPDEAL